MTQLNASLLGKLKNSENFFLLRFRVFLWVLGFRRSVGKGLPPSRDPHTGPARTGGTYEGAGIDSKGIRRTTLGGTPQGSKNVHDLRSTLAHRDSKETLLCHLDQTTYLLLLGWVGIASY